MKRIIFFFLAFFPLVLLAQDAQLKFWANGTEYPEVLEIDDFKRVTVLVQDGAPRDGSVVYEFGPVRVYKVAEDGSRTLVKVINEGGFENIPMLNFVLSPSQNPDLLGEHLMEIEWVKRYNADKSIDELNIEGDRRSIMLSIHEK